MRMACKATTEDENGAEVGYGVSGTVEAAEGRESLVLRARLTD
jgi:hypothetical protein